MAADADRSSLDLEVWLGGTPLPAGIKLAYHVNFRRQERVGDAFKRTAKAARLTLNDLAQQVMDDANPRRVELFERMAMAAAEKADVSHRKALAGVVARGVQGDDAELIAALVRVETIRALTPLHVRVMAVLATDPPGVHVPGRGWLAEEIAPLVPGLLPVADRVMATLTSEGVVRDVAPASVMNLPAGTPVWALTPYGVDILADLAPRGRKARGRSRE